MIRARITIARQRAKAIAAGVPGLDASFIALGVVAPEQGDEDDVPSDFFKLLRAKNPVTWSSSAGHATITLDSDHSFSVGQLLVISVTGLMQDYAVAITAITHNSFTFLNPEPGVSVSTFAEGDLVYTLRLVIKAATPVDFKVQEAIGESTVDVLLYFGIEYASQTFIALESLAMNLRAALADPSNWANINDGPDDVKMEEPRLMRKDNPVPGYYKITLTFNGV